MDVEYEELGLKVGLEIHRQLDTNKLFSPSPSVEFNDDFEIERKLRPTMSEMGEIDQAALEEVKKGKKFVYHGNEKKSDLVYLDEEPPHTPNGEALDTGLQISFLLNCVPVDQVHFMRKVVIDGSTISGFQRTAVIGTNGNVSTDYGEVGISSLCLEEDASKIIERSDKEVHYDLSRLGIPLVEITTSPDIRHPEEAKDVAYKIGQALKATGKVKRGLGSIRQDLNISIENGGRIEVKGVQDLDLLENLVRNEVKRQISLLKISEELENREIDIKENYVNLTDVFEDTDSGIIKNQIKSGGKVFGVLLKGFNDLIGKEIQPNRRLGTEMADRAQKFVKGIFHSDELPSYGISKEELNQIREDLNINKEDSNAFVLVASEEEKAKKALDEVIKRARETQKGVPEETRKALEDGNTKYMRPLPGKARMYPETDVPPVEIRKEKKNKISQNLPKTPDQLIKEIKEDYGLEENLAKQIVEESRGNLFEQIVDIGEDPNFVASFLTGKMKSMSRDGFEVNEITDDEIFRSFKMLSSNEISKEGLEDLIKGLAQEGLSVKEIVERKGLKSMSKDEVEEIVEEIVQKNIDTIEEQGMRSMGQIMGKAMDQLRGKADGELVNQVVKEKIQENLN